MALTLYTRLFTIIGVRDLCAVPNNGAVSPLTDLFGMYDEASTAYEVDSSKQDIFRF